MRITRTCFVTIGSVATVQTAFPSNMLTSRQCSQATPINQHRSVAHASHDKACLDMTNDALHDAIRQIARFHLATTAASCDAAHTAWQFSHGSAALSFAIRTLRHQLDV
jgi:hypothetical protein